LKKNLFLPIEIKHREFFSKLFLASYAIKSGFRVYIGSSDSIFRLIKTKKQKGGIFFYKGGLELNKILELKKKCDHFVVLDEEMASQKYNYAEVAKARIWPGTEKFISRYYVISKFGYKASRNVFTEMKDRVRCTGWPRVDLWKKENSYLFKKETELIKKKYGKFILFSSDFTYNSRRIINDKIIFAKNSNWKSLRDKEKIISTNSEKILKEYNHFLKILLDYDKIKGLPQIIIRPHPTDDLDAWYEFSKKVKNIKVIYKGEITPWINASSGLLHRGCTSSVQAFMSGTPSGYIVKENSNIKELPYSVSEHINTFNDLVSFCKKKISNHSEEKINNYEEFNEMIYVDQNKMSAELIIDDLLSLETSSELNFKVNFKNKIVDFLIIVKKNLKKTIKAIFKVQEKLGIAPDYRKIPGGINSNEVERFLKKVNKNDNLNIKKIFDSCIEIE